MTPADYVIVFLTLLSAAVGVWRGFTAEALSVLTLLAAIWLAWAFAGLLAPHLGEWDSAVEVRLWVARVIIFFTVIVVGGLASWLARKFIRHTGLSAIDRMLGAAFGLVRAAVLVGLGVIVMQFTELDREAWWQDARLRPHAERVAEAVRYYAELGAEYWQQQAVGSGLGGSTRVVAYSV
jgi:membrane protein required for colicin V production